MKKTGSRIVKVFRILLVVLGSMFLLLCIVALTKLPFYGFYNLGTSNSRMKTPPVNIVLLSGNGIPSESGLLRAYYTARLANKYPTAQVYISIPGNVNDTAGAAQLTSKELQMRGIDTSRIYFENLGRNTREQAQKLAEGLLKEKLQQPITVVTAPEHIKRAVLAFRKCGFTTVSGFPTFENSLNADLTYNDSELKGNKMAPAIGNSLQVRYQFWTHLKLEILVLREYFALTYYKLRGWI